MATTTWKQLVQDSADAYRSITGSTAKVKVKELYALISNYKSFPWYPNGTE